MQTNVHRTPHYQRFIFLLLLFFVGFYGVGGWWWELVWNQLFGGFILDQLNQNQQRLMLWCKPEPRRGENSLLLPQVV